MSDTQWAGYTGQCNPEVWNGSSRPPQPTEKKIGQLTEDQIEQYYREGVVLIEDYFTPDELEPIKEELGNLVDFLADRLYEEGLIKSRYEEYSLFNKLTMVNKDYKGANILMNKLSLIPQSIAHLWSGEKLCNAVEQLIGPDIGGHPVWNLRTKVPQDEASTVPWHQDCAYLDPRSYDVHQPTAWIPMLDTNAKNGCMEFAVKGHQKGKIAMHQCCEGDTHYVMLKREEMENDLGVNWDTDLKVYPVKYGSMVLFNNCIPHRSLNNLSEEIRWSIDLRWQNPKQPYGFHGVAEGITFRKADDPTWRPQQQDWDAFLRMTRVSKTNDPQENNISGEELKKLYTLDTTITGPWMRNWELVNMNRHTDGLTSTKGTTWHE